MNFEFIELEQIETLKTLEVLVSEIDIYVNQSKNYVRGYGIVSEWNEFLKETVKLSDFVPCGADGLPVEEPIKIGMGIAENAYKEAMEKYQKAKQAVIFEGFYISSTSGKNFIIRNAENISLQFEVDFNGQYTISVANNRDYLVVISTYSDLAKATIDNPLKLK